LVLNITQHFAQVLNTCYYEGNIKMKITTQAIANNTVFTCTINHLIMAALQGNTDEMEIKLCIRSYCEENDIEYKMGFLSITV
jgi:hypothetical protein